MQRLVAWYQVGSSYGAVVALIVANLVPLAGVLFFGWDVWGILIIYWLENGIVGLFNVLKMRRAEGPEDGVAGRDARDPPAAQQPDHQRPPGERLGQGGAHPVLHHALRHVLGRPRHLRADASRCSRSRAPTASPTSGPPSNPLAILFALVCLFISHGVSYRLNYIGRGEYLRTTAAGQMFAPYGRLVVLHITIIFGAIADLDDRGAGRRRSSSWCCSRSRSTSGSTWPSTASRRRRSSDLDGAAS